MNPSWNEAQQLYAAALANHKALDYIDAAATEVKTSTVISGGETSKPTVDYYQYEFKVICPGGANRLAYVYNEASDGTGNPNHMERQYEYYDFKSGMYYSYITPGPGATTSAYASGDLKNKYVIPGDPRTFDPFWLPEAADLQDAKLDGDTITADCPAIPARFNGTDGTSTPISGEISAVIQNGQLISVHQKWSRNTTWYNDDRNETYDSTVNYQNIGQPVSITLPKDLDSYTLG